MHRVVRNIVVDSGSRGVTLGHVVIFLREHWEMLHAAHFKDDTFSLLMTMEKVQFWSSATRNRTN